MNDEPHHFNPCSTILLMSNTTYYYSCHLPTIDIYFVKLCKSAVAFRGNTLLFSHIEDINSWDWWLKFFHKSSYNSKTNFMNFLLAWPKWSKKYILNTHPLCQLLLPATFCINLSAMRSIIITDYSVLVDWSLLYTLSNNHTINHFTSEGIETWSVPMTIIRQNPCVPINQLTLILALQLKSGNLKSTCNGLMSYSQRMGIY